MSFINPDHHNARNEGYKKGKADFENKKGEKGPGLFSKVMLIGMFSPNIGKFVGVDNRKAYVNKWFDGYKAGYSETMTIANFVDSTNSKSEKNNLMSQQNSYSYQIEILEDLKSYLDGFQSRLQIVVSKYDEKATSFSAAGMMYETFEDFMNRCVDPTKEKIKELIDQINEVDIPFVEKEIAFLESH